MHPRRSRFRGAKFSGRLINVHRCSLLFGIPSCTRTPRARLSKARFAKQARALSGVLLLLLEKLRLDHQPAN
jgi:hypothetical protein